MVCKDWYMLALGANVVLEPPRHLRQERVHHAEDVVTVLLGVDQYADGDQVVDLVEVLFCDFIFL